MKRMLSKIILLSILSIFFVFFKVAKASESFSLILDKATIKKGYTFKTADKNLTLGFLSDFLDKSAEDIKVTVVDNGKEEIITPNNKNLISNLYEIEIGAKEFAKPYILILNYFSENDSAKEIYFYNQALNKWSAIKPLAIDKEKKTIKIKLKASYAKLAVLEEKPLLGKASWYKCIGGDYAASIEYPKKSFLKVTNLENGKSVIVKVNDYGPDRKIHPDRIIDLDVFAFKKIANKRAGVINVKVEKL